MLSRSWRSDSTAAGFEAQKVEGLIDWLSEYHPIIQALLATLFTWGVTAAGAALVLSMRPILPYALAFAAGAMIFVVVEELIPESHSNGFTGSATAGAMLGFAIMMSLDVALG